MSKRQVWVIEGRRMVSKYWVNTAQKPWIVQQSGRLKDMRAALAIYRDGRNPKHEFRVTKYVPEAK